MRRTPFALVFADLARERFPAIAERLAPEPGSAADRDHFVLLEPVGRLLREIMPEDAGADALEAHVRMLHHAYRHWAAGGWVYRIGEPVLRRATGATEVASQLPHPALYLQLPEVRVWGSPTPGAAPEPLDGIFVAEAARPREIAVLGIFGMREGRPGFSAVGLEGRADADDAVGGGAEIEVTAARADGSAPFSPMLAGGEQAGIYSLATAGELLLLTCRLLALLPARQETGTVTRETNEGIERVVPVE